MTLKKGELENWGAVMDRIGFLIYYSGGKVFPGADKFYVVAMAVGGSSGMEVKIIAIGGYLRTETLKTQSHPG